MYLGISITTLRWKKHSYLISSSSLKMTICQPQRYSIHHNNNNNTLNSSSSNNNISNSHCTTMKLTLPAIIVKKICYCLLLMITRIKFLLIRCNSKIRAILYIKHIHLIPKLHKTLQTIIKCKKIKPR